MATEILPTHHCFDDALEIIEALVTVDRSLAHKLTLVHAICLMPDDRPYAHAWVELDGDCLFRGIVDGETMELAGDKAGFYKEYRVQETTRYTMRQAWAENVRTNHYGPWQQKYLDLCNPNGHRPSYAMTMSDAGQPGLFCNTCGQISYDPAHVKERYCPQCDEYLVDDNPKPKSVPRGIGEMG